MRRLFLLAALFATVGCGNKSDPVATQSDSGVADTAHDTRPIPPDIGMIYPEFTCGPGPYVEQELKVYGQTIAESAKKQPYQHIRFTMSACPEVKAESDEEGYAILHMTIGKPNSFTLDADGWLKTRWFEATPQKWAAAQTLTLTTLDAKDQLPGFDKGVVLVDVGAAATGTCVSNEGVAISVPDHPEAVVSYHASGSPYAPVAGATGTTTIGLASITGIAAGTRITVVGKKDGCDVAPYASPGGIVVEPNIVGRATLFVRDPLPSCGAAPWVLLQGHLTTRETSGMAGTALEGVNVSFDACPGVVAKTDASGAWSAWMSTSMPFSRRNELADYFVTNLGEEAWPSDYDKLDLALRNATTWKPLMPGFDDKHAYVLVGVAANTTGACKGSDGVAISIAGHPDAKIMYMDGDPPKPTTGTVTTKRGIAYISGLTPGMLDPKAITGTRASDMCTYSLIGGLSTGRAHLDAGALTIVSIYPP